MFDGTTQITSVHVTLDADMAQRLGLTGAFERVEATAAKVAAPRKCR